jgi:hypothetical protein
MDIIPLNNRPYHHHNQYYNSENSEKDRLFYDVGYSEEIAVQKSLEEAQVYSENYNEISGEELIQEEDSFEFYIPKEEAFSACPILLTQMERPVMAQCGHSFEPEGINGWAASTREGAPLICPVGREIIDPDHLSNNILGRDGIEHIRKLNGHIENANAKVKEQQKTNRDLKTDNAKLNKQLKVSDKRLEVSYKQLASSNREKSELNERVEFLSSTEDGQMANMMLNRMLDLINTVKSSNNELKYEIIKSREQSREEIKECREEVKGLRKEVTQLKTTVADQDSKIYVMEKECGLYKLRLEKAVSIGFFQNLAVGIGNLAPCLVDYDMKYITESGTEEMERAIVMLKQNEQHIKQASLDIQKANREEYVPINNTFIQEI